MVDDGDFSVPRQFLDGWQNAGSDANPLSRQVRMTRYVTNSATAGDASMLLLNTLDKTQIK
jgi:hypothetical protein